MTAAAITMNVITATRAMRRGPLRLQRLAGAVANGSMRVAAGELICPATPVAVGDKKADGAARIAVAAAVLSPAGGAATSIIELSAAKGSGAKACRAIIASFVVSSAISPAASRNAGVPAASPLPDFVTLATKR